MKSRKAIKRIVDAKVSKITKDAREKYSEARYALLNELSSRINTIKCEQVVSRQEIEGFRHDVKFEKLAKIEAVARIAQEIMDSDCVKEKIIVSKEFVRYTFQVDVLRR